MTSDTAARVRTGHSDPARPAGPASSRPRRRGGRGPARPAADRTTTDRTATDRTAPVPASSPMPAASRAPVGASTFAELGLSAALVEALSARGVSAPFPIQAATLPDSLAGRDVLGRGRTGSGKTLAFSLPIVQRLSASGTPRRARRPRALVLVPTRELANQVREVLEPLAAAAGLRTAVVFGGVGQNPQAAALRAGVDVLVACPGRLEDLIKQQLCDLGDVEIAVLDEADHMADLGFLPAVKRLLDATPPRGQRLLFSATLDNGIDVLVRRYLTDPVLHSVDPAVAPVSTMTHHVFEVSGGDKPAVVRELASGEGRSLLFTRTKHGAKKLAKQLTAAGVPAVDLHGNLAQKARERNLEAFSAGTVKVLVATDIAARGIHVDDIELVVHVDPPAEHKAYLHRSGRTARAGSEGVVVTVMTPDQRGDVRTLARQAGIAPRFSTVAPGSGDITRLTGPAAAYVTPAPEAPRTPDARPGGGGSRGRRPSGSGSSRPAGRSSAPAGGGRTPGRSSGAGSAAAFSASRTGGARRGSGSRAR